MQPERGFSTQAVHGGEPERKPWSSLTVPIAQTAVYTFDDTASMLQYQEEVHREGRASREEYGRYGNPTQHAAEAKLAALEGGESALLFASGMCAITSTLLALLSTGDHLVMTDDCYRRTRTFCLEFLQRFGIATTVVPAGDYEALAQAVRPTTRVIFAESPSNPYLRVLDIPRAVAIAHDAGALLLVDSTFATPYNVRPLDLGADLVVHSTTKYLSGHNDVLGGVVIGPWQYLQKIKDARGTLGGVISPHAAYLLLRGLKTLGLRMAHYNEVGARIAAFLHGHPAVERVHYPGLPGHPQHHIARRLLRNELGGAMVSFELATAERARVMRFFNALRLCIPATTLGDVYTLLLHPATSSHSYLTPEERRTAGISEGLVRISAGIEYAGDIIADLDQALRA